MLKNRDKLLADVASQLRAHERRQIVHIRVTLFAGDREVKEFLGLVEALDALVNGWYWDVEGDWRDADRAVVDTY